jgi:uroporphyrinogen III methyltransferase/synthase
LVGAGPGDPGLITVRGRDLLARADVVVYDALAHPRLLKHCPPGCERIYVGKRASHHSMTQEQINALLVDLGRTGKRVVRLKGGDPFVFGRGGEECQALRDAGVRFEIVPGITAGIAAPAYAGIPVTHRDLNSSFTLITGHEKEDAFKDAQSLTRDKATGSSDVDWSAIAKLPCVAFYMGVKALPRITARLIEHGLSPDTPAATIQSGTTPAQRTVVATVATIVDACTRARIGAPAITIIGRVVEMRSAVNWFESRPLYGQTVLVTRTRHQSSELAALLEEQGAAVLEAPTIDIVEPTTWDHVDHPLKRLRDGGYDWLVFTSANGVSAARSRLRALGFDARAMSTIRVACVGASTAQACERELGIVADLVPARAIAESLADELASRGEVTSKRFLLLRADIARPTLVERLRAGGASAIDDVAIYTTQPATSLPDPVLESLKQKQIDWITFTSASTARNLVALAGVDALKGINLASIGPVTSDAVRSLGLDVTVEAPHADLDALVEVMAWRAARS